MSEAKLDSNDLLSCPFCGNTPEVRDIHSDEVKERDAAARKKGYLIPAGYVPWDVHSLTIECRKCGIEFDESLTNAMRQQITPLAVSEARLKLAKKWNTRQDNPTGQERKASTDPDCSK